MKKLVVRLLVMILMAATGVVVASGHAAATTLQSTVLPPLDGVVTSSPDEPHHTPYGGDYSFDVAGSGLAYARFRNTNGSLTLSVGAIGPACASGAFRDGGNRIQLIVSINGTRVGTVTYAHLTDFRYTSGNVPVGAAIGRPVTAADGVAKSGCWGGTHVHVEPRNDKAYGCYFPGQLNARVTAANALGIVGGEYAHGINAQCPAGAEAGGGGGLGDGQFVSVIETGWVFKIAGGAPLYVSTWDHVGGPQPTTPISLAQLDALPAVPRDGTLISAQPSGRVFVVAGGAPLYVSSWDNVGGMQPTIAVDDAAVDNAGGGEPWNHLRAVPSDGFLHGHSSGRVFRVVGGHPYYVSSWDPFGGPQPAVDVDDNAIDTCDHLNCNPFGALDSAADAGDRIRVTGWAMDPNDTTPIGVHVYVDGTYAGAGIANRSRPDVDAVFHRGPTYGYNFTVPAKVGTHQVCTYGLNTGAGSSDQVGCTSVTVTPAPRVVVNPNMSGTVRVGGTVTCRPGSWQYATSFSYRWLRDGKAITGAARTTYRVPESDYLHKLSCQVTGHNQVAIGRAASASHSIAAGPALKVTTRPTLSGVSRVGKRLTVSTGRWSPTATAIRYHWRRDGRLISGATKKTYVGRKRDRNHRISCTVRASRDGWITGRFTTRARVVA